MAQPQDMRTFGSNETRPATTSPKKEEPAETPLPSFEPAALEADIEQERKPITIKFPPREYPCYDKMPARLSVRMQERLTGLAKQFKGKKEQDLSVDQANEMMKQLGFLIDVLEVIVHKDSLPELIQRIDRADSPHGTIELHEILDPLMAVIGEYSNRDAGKR